MGLDNDDELPWDPLWAYILGEGEDQRPKPATRRRSKQKGVDEEGFLSYISDIIPEPESRDDGWFSDDKRTDRRDEGILRRRSFGSTEEPRRRSFGSTEEATTKKGSFWNRGKRESSSVESEYAESWEWQLDTNEYGDEPYVPPKRVDPPKTERSNNKQGTMNRKKKEKAATKSTSGRKTEPAVSESWEWPLTVGSANDDAKKSRRAFFRKKEKDTSGSWDWPLGSQVSTTTKKKDGRKVRFAKSSREKEETAMWPATEDVVAQLQRSQNSLLDWVGLNESLSSDTFDEEALVSPSTRGAPAKNTRSSIPPAREKKKDAAAPTVRATQEVKTTTRLGKRDTSTTPLPASNSFVFGDMFSNWGDLSSSDDSTLNSSSTQESSAISTEDFSEDGTKSTQQSDVSSTVHNNASSSRCAPPLDGGDNNTTPSTDDNGEFTEVRLAYQPPQQNEMMSSGNLLPIINEENSIEEPHFYSDERSLSGSDHTRKRVALVTSNEQQQESIDRRLDSFNSLLEVVELSHNQVSEDADDDAVFDEQQPRVVDDSRQKQSRLLGKARCRGINTLSHEQLKWTTQSGVPFHELSQQELAQIFPKVRSVTDGQQYVTSEVLVNPRNYVAGSRSGPAHFQASFEGNGPQSLFEYEYETGIHMFVSFDAIGVGADAIKVNTAVIPKPQKCKGKHRKSVNEVLVQVEASTVSRTDCHIRQGNWKGKQKVPIPYTPGVDAVGRLYRVDSDAAKRYGLSIGDRVMTLAKWGGNARYLSVDPSTIVKVPESMDPATAVCLAETYLTAFQILHRGQTNRVRYQNRSLKEKNVLILGQAVSNMGRAIAQLAVDAGASQVYAMAKSKYFARISSLGIIPIHQDSAESWRKLAGNMDMILSIDGEIMELHRELLAGHGKIIDVKNGINAFSLQTARSRSVCNGGQNNNQQPKWIINYDVFEEWTSNNNIERCKLDLKHLIQLLEQRKIEPYILDRVALNKVARAQEIVESKRLDGFIVCEPWLVAKSRAIRL